jgi:hypothetical protein
MGREEGVGLAQEGGWKTNALAVREVDLARGMGTAVDSVGDLERGIQDSVVARGVAASIQGKPNIMKWVVATGATPINSNHSTTVSNSNSGRLWGKAG